MGKISGVYKIENLINGKVYIGSSIDLKRRKRSHFSELKLNKHGSGHLQNAYNLYGKENFKFEIVEIVFDKNELVNREDYWINLLNANNSDFGYNIREKAFSNLGFHHSEESKKKISENSATPFGEENYMFGTKRSEETRNQISQTLIQYYKTHVSFNLGKIQSKETIDKKANSNRGKKRSPETGKRISEANKGRKLSEESKKRMSINRKGIKISEETKMKMSNSAKGKNNWSKGCVQSEDSIEKRVKSIIGVKNKKNSSSKYVGVSFDKNVKVRHWASYLNYKKKRYNLGHYFTEVEAALAYNQKALELFGEKARLNIIEEKED